MRPSVFSGIECERSEYATRKKNTDDIYQNTGCIEGIWYTIPMNRGRCNRLMVAFCDEEAEDCHEWRCKHEWNAFDCVFSVRICLSAAIGFNK